MKRVDNSKVLIIYHGNCIDGMTAAWVMWNHFKDKTTVILHAGEYGKPFPETDAETIYVVDFSYPRDIILEQRKTHKVIIIDHHASAIAKLKDLEDTHFDIDQSGAGLALEYIQRHLNAKFDPVNDLQDQWIEKLVLHVQDRDLNKFDLRDTENYHAYLTGMELDIKVWDMITKTSPNTIISEGFAMAKYHRALIGKLIKNNIIWMCVDGYPNIPVFNTTKELGGDTCNEMLKRNPHIPFSLYFYHYMDKGEEMVYYGARSIEHNLIPLAASYNGGGHAQAAAWMAKPSVIIGSRSEPPAILAQ